MAASSSQNFENGLSCNDPDAILPQIIDPQVPPLHIASNGLSSRQVKSVPKRFFICCDGTWEDGINNRGPITHVSRLARCINNVAWDGYLQVVYYDGGVGNGTDLVAQAVDAATGRGISAKIRNAYSFLSHNYNFDNGDDEIFLIGYSRGAFTVQCLASLISQIGLLRKEDLVYLRGLYTLWAKQEHRTQWGGRRKPLEDLCDVVNKLTVAGATKRDVRIKACAVWDTVSALGVPTIMLSPRPLSFVGKKVPGIVDYAFQALALNESRRHFKPCMWESCEANAEKVKQCWFLGTHADVAGGNQDSGLSAFSYSWMIAQLKRYTTADLGGKGSHFLSPGYLQWEGNINKALKKYMESWKIGEKTPALGQVKKTGWYWGLAGLRSRRKHLTLNSSNNNPRVEATTVQSLPMVATKPNFSITVHFSVRLMMAEKRNKCSMLKKWMTEVEGSNVLWKQPEILGISGIIMGISGNSWLNGRLFEDEVDGCEWAFLKEWCRYSHVPQESGSTPSGCEALPMFLHQFVAYEKLPSVMYKRASRNRTAFVPRIIGGKKESKKGVDVG
ncbi:hypothetical protein FQN52_008519 [Onygenales sp. PD_12]|nr:hypothetical protein FQN52_008519 [Onygenales sp. PD_12]